MMEVVIVDDGNRLTVYELVERVIPCIIAKHYSENYIQGFRSTFRNLLAYCSKNEKKYFTAELAQQFMLDCYGVQPGTVERRCSRVHRAMDLLSDYQHFNAVMLRRRLNREFPAGLQEGAVNYLQKLSLHGRRENTLRSHRNVLLRFTDYLFSVGVTDYKSLSADIVNRYVKVVSCNYSNSVVRLHYSILLRFFQYLAHSGYKETDLSLKMMPIVKVSASARIPTTLDLSQIESILASVDRESPQGKRDYAVLMIAVKLGMNYIRFWQAAGESEKTSIRTRDRIRQIVSSGHYTGGFVCYGYQLVDQGRRNKRDKPVMDLVINEEEATWVRELFYKVIQEGTSGYALAEMLNNRGLRTRAGAKFQSSNILRIIRHEGYTGYIITKNARSEYIPELQIIDQETFEKANDIISRRSAKTAQDRRIAHTSQNPTLLAGIVYCAHCGAKMSGFMHTDRYKLADGSIREKVQPKYNCFQRGQRNKGGRDCDGQALYLAERVDAIVLKIVEEVFEQIRDTPYSQVAENRIRQESNLQKTKRAAAEKKIKAAQHALERFEGEILKCLDGTSNFTEDMIAKQIRRYQQELDDAKAEYAELQNARLNEAAEIRKLRTYYDDFKGWAEEFDTAPLEMKRMILSHLIDRVEVGRKYQVIVKFNMKYRQFLECTAETYNTEIGA